MLSFLLTSLLIELTPGPNMTWLAVLGARAGRAAALSAVAGIALGLAFAGLVAGVGLSALVTAEPWAFNSLRWLGSAYLLWLAFDAWSDADGKGKAEPRQSGRHFLQGLLTNVLNPKAYLFYAAILPQFLGVDEDPATQIAILTAAYVAVATTVHAAIALAAGSLAGWLAVSPQAVLIRRAMALSIAAVAVWFFIATRTS